jgi:hypothetical protein
MANIHDQAREFLSSEKLGLFFSNEKKKTIFLFCDWLSEQAAQHTLADGRAGVCPECGSEIAVCMMGHYCGDKTPPLTRTVRHFLREA